ncbi:MAG: T9SS type A sorting domain-containing protein [Bacteroidales bacterium]
MWSSEQITFFGNYSLGSLEPQTSYDFRVKSVCNNAISGWVTISFMTSCSEISTLPWTDNFDSYGTGSTVFPNCWTRNTTQTDRPYVSTTNFSAPGSLYFYAGSGTYNIAATPEFDSSIPVNTLQATFMYRTTNNSDTLFIGVMTDPTVASTFAEVAFVTNTSTSTWYEKEISFENYTGNGQYIAFKVRYGSTYTYGYIDNLEINLVSNCPRPNQLQLISAGATELEVGWTENGTATNWIVEYKKVTDTDWEEDLANTNPYTITNLDPATEYMIRVQADHTIHVDFEVGINENELSQYVTLYPNPTQSFIDLKLNRDYLGATECYIYDMYGKLMRALSVEEEITSIDVSDFAAGVYFVRLTTEQGQVSKRFVKQ